MSVAEHKAEELIETAREEAVEVLGMARKLAIHKLDDAGGVNAVLASINISMAKQAVALENQGVVSVLASASLYCSQPRQ